MYLSRRSLLKTATAASILPALPARAADKIPLRINLLGYALGVHMPTTAAVFDVLPGMGYTPQTRRMDQMRTLTQTLVAGAADLGETDPITTMSAVESGADLKIIGLWYRSTDLVFVASADHIHELKDLANPNNIVAVNDKGDITDVMMVGTLLKNGIDPNKVQIVEIGGSGARMRALLSGRVQAVPVHFDQAADVAKQGNFKILFKPWVEFPDWVNEVWVTRGDWLSKKENQRAVVDLLKAEMTCFGKADSDINWYTAVYQKYATLPDAKKATPESLKPLWEGLTKEINAWPRHMELKVENFSHLATLYKDAGAIRGTVKVENVIEPAFVQQAASELGA